MLNNLTRLLKVRCTEEMYRALKRRATEDGETVSTIVRDAVRRYLGVER